MEKLPKVAFVCTHNSCRSQIAEAIAAHLADDVFESFSAGTEIKESIDGDAARTVKRLYGIDIDESQRPKTLAEIPPVDIVVTMGCGVRCPSLPCSHREDWDLDDPTGKGDEAFAAVAESIHRKVLDLKTRISKGGW
ncbi:MAG: arsenate reductase ArsC [Coriobacteriia bacterium]|nr:arsenate reductase ArsC [Coriobacteriia bacterium]